MNNDIAHVVYASDDKFVEILGVSLVSLYKSSEDMDDIKVYILDDDISVENKKRIESICNSFNRSRIKWLQARNIRDELSMDVLVDRGSISQFSRIYISSVIPDDIERVLYLDCDVIVKKSIRELWNLELQGKTVAALSDAFSSLYRKNIGLEKNDIMFNSGVMLIDLKLWREQKIEEQLIDFIKLKHGRVQQGDQGVLNAVLSDKTFCFEPKFNCISIYYDFTYEEMLIYRKPSIGYYSEIDIKQAVNNPSIIHFTTSFLSKRPWIEGCKHRYVNLWLYYRKMTAWSTSPLHSDSTGITKRILVMMLKKLPRRVMVRLCGIVQAYIRPILMRVI